MSAILPAGPDALAEVINCDFTKDFRTSVLDSIISIGAYRTRVFMLDAGFHRSFVDVLIRRLRTGG